MRGVVELEETKDDCPLVFLGSEYWVRIFPPCETGRLLLRPIQQEPKGPPPCYLTLLLPIRAGDETENQDDPEKAPPAGNRN